MATEIQHSYLPQPDQQLTGNVHLSAQRFIGQPLARHPTLHQGGIKREDTHRAQGGPPTPSFYPLCALLVPLL